MNRRQWLAMVAAALPAWRVALRARAPDFGEILKIDVHLDGIAQRLDRYPNFHIECAARTRNLARRPSDTVRSLFIKRQLDRRPICCAFCSST